MLRNKFRKTFGGLIWKVNPKISVWDLPPACISSASRLREVRSSNWNSMPTSHGFWKRRNLSSQEPNDFSYSDDRLTDFLRFLRFLRSGLCVLCVRFFFFLFCANRKARVVPQSPPPRVQIVRKSPAQRPVV